MNLERENPITLGRESLPKNEANREERRTERKRVRAREQGRDGERMSLELFVSRSAFDFYNLSQRFLV